MWNYRIGTKVVTANGERAFFIFECYYNKNKIPDGYPEKIDRFKFPNLLVSWNNIKELQGTYELIVGAFDKPVIDLDNWPNEYVKSKRKKKS